MADKVVLEVLCFTVLSAYFAPQNIQARLLNLDKLFVSHGCLSHFALDFSFDDFVAPSRE